LVIHVFMVDSSPEVASVSRWVEVKRSWLSGRWVPLLIFIAMWGYARWAQPWSWAWAAVPFVVVALGVLAEGLRRWPLWPRVWPWSLGALVVTGVALMIIGFGLGALSAFAGVAWRFEVPWGLVWATSGNRAEGIAFESGDGLLLTPFFVAVVMGAGRLLAIRRGLRQEHPPAS
jgi:hypothetical protein